MEITGNCCSLLAKLSRDSYSQGRDPQRSRVQFLPIPADLKFLFRFPYIGCSDTVIPQQYQNTKYAEKHTIHRFFSPHTAVLLLHAQYQFCALLSAIQLYFADPLELLWAFPSLQPCFCQQKPVTLFQHRGNEFRKGGKAGAVKVDLYPFPSRSARSTWPLHRRLFKQNKIAGVGGQKAGKGSLGRGGMLSGGEDSFGIRSLVPQWSGERKTHHYLVLQLPPWGHLSLEEVLARSQQTRIQLASTGLAKEDKRHFSLHLPPFQSTVHGLQASFMALSVLDIMTFGFMILTNMKIQIASQTTTNLRAF